MLLGPIELYVLILNVFSRTMLQLVDMNDDKLALGQQIKDLKQQGIFL